MSNTNYKIVASFAMTFLLTMPIQGKVPAKTDVLIVGAGLGGMASAYYLKQQNPKMSFHILEVLPRVGGRVRTVHYQRPGQKDFYADSGMEEYWESNPAVKILQELRLPVRSDVALSSLVLDKKLYPMGDEDRDEFWQKIFNAQELKALHEFFNLSKQLTHGLSTSTPLKKELLALQDISFADWLKSLKLPTKVIEWIRLSVECEMGTSIAQVSALEGLAEMHIFLDGGEKSYRVLGGNEKFALGLAKAVGEEHISLSKRVQRIKQVGNKVHVYYLDEVANTNSIIEANYVITTVPLFRLNLEIQFEPALPEKKIQAIQSMTWGSYFKAHVFLPAKAEKLWIRNGISILPILTDNELGVIYDGNPDQPGTTRILSLLIHGEHAEKFNFMPLASARKIITDKLDQLIPGIAALTQEIEVYRYHPRAIASWPVGRSRFDAQANAIRTPHGLVYLGGDFTEGTHSAGAFHAAQRIVADIVKRDAKAVH